MTTMADDSDDLETYVADYRADLIDLAFDLLAVDTTNPPGDTREIVSLLEEYLAGLPVDVVQPAPPEGAAKGVRLAVVESWPAGGVTRRRCDSYARWRHTLASAVVRPTRSARRLIPRSIFRSMTKWAGSQTQ